VAFAKKQLIGEIVWSNSVIISDERRFALHDDSRRAWLKRGVYNEGSFKNQEKYSKSIMVWAAIGKGWRSPLVIVRGTLNADRYIDLLNENQIIEKLDSRYGNHGYHFQYDGAPAHRCSRTVNWMRERSNIIEDWPPNSPDISCIENLWGVLKQRVVKRDPASVQELERDHVEEWQELDQKIIDDLIDSNLKRFQLIVEEGGGSINHLIHQTSKNRKHCTQANHELIWNCVYNNNPADQDENNTGETPVRTSGINDNRETPRKKNIFGSSSSFENSQNSFRSQTTEDWGTPSSIVKTYNESIAEESSQRNND
jgi:hypothetical protein